MYHLLQEGIVDDITSVGKLIIAARDGFSQGYTDTLPNGTNKNSLRTYSYSSAAKAASNLICVFPVLTSRTVSADTAQKISKFIEQKGCIILQMALQAANISNAKNGIDYLRNFHQNLNIGGDGVSALTKTLNAWVDGLDDTRVETERDNERRNGGAYTTTGNYRFRESAVTSLIKEDLNSRKEVDDSAVYESDDSIHITPAQMNALLKEFADAEKYVVYDTKLNPVSIDDYYVNENAYDTYHVDIKRYDTLNEAPNPRVYRSAISKAIRDKNKAEQERKDAISERDKAIEEKRNAADLASTSKRLAHKYEKEAKDAEARAKTANKNANDAEKNARNAEALAQEELDKAIARRDEKYRREDERYKREVEKYNTEKERQTIQWKQQQRDRLNQTVRKTSFEIMKDQDIKKMNNAVPSLLIVRFYSDSKATVATEFIIGVKSKVVPCNSDEILRRIANNNKDGRFMVNLLRTVSGEMKKSDFLFGISRTQEDLMSINKKGSHGDTWALLQSRALAAKQAVKQGRVNDFSAITTVVISQADADDLFKEENIDITDPKVAVRFMQSYNLLGFIIVDDATESVKMLFDDGDNYFEELSYMMLDRETDDKNYKKLINLIASSR